MVDYGRLATLYRNVNDEVYEHRPRVVAGRLGDGTTEKRVDVPGSTIHVYFRPRLTDTEIWEVRHTLADVPRWHGWPCFCQWSTTILEWEIKETDVDQLPGQFDEFAFRYVTSHASQHIINESSVGGDPVWIYRRAIVDLRPRPPPDSSFRLYISRGSLPFETVPIWVGSYGPDLTPYIPASAEVWVTHYIDRAGEAHVIVGDTHSPDYRSFATPPRPPAGTVPVGYVALASDTTSITEAEIWDARQPWAMVAIDEAIEQRINKVIEYQEWMWAIHLQGGS